MVEKIPQFGDVEGIPWCAGEVETALDTTHFLLADPGIFLGVSPRKIFVLFIWGSPIALLINQESFYKTILFVVFLLSPDKQIKILFNQVNV